MQDSELITLLKEANAQANETLKALQEARRALFNDPTNPANDPDTDDARPPSWNEATSRIKAAISVKYPNNRAPFNPGESESLDDL